MTLANDDACEKMISRARSYIGHSYVGHSIQGNDGFFRSGGSFRSCLRLEHGTKELQWSPPSFYFFHLRWWWIGQSCLLYFALLTYWLTWNKMDKLRYYPHPSLLAFDSAKSGSNYLLPWDMIAPKIVSKPAKQGLWPRGAWLIGSLGSCLGGKERYIIDKHRVSLTLLVTQH